MNESTTPPPSGGSNPDDVHTILVVEDKAEIRTVIRTFLIACGHICITAETAEQALALLLNKPQAFDRILSNNDLGSGMKGKDFIGIVRQMFSSQGYHICFMSGEMKPELERAALSAGANTVLSKPFELKPLLAALDIKKLR